ncbi:MAG: toll/interleukin-1 receptor domain-containing protein [Crocinitomicaceae bacterium]|nr:toll/interleukin-1 receptor domain-containing protein [Crocinitomicaceae bacterium]
MEGVNRAKLVERLTRLLSENKEKDVPCIFISYQRRDEDYAVEVASYIKDHQIDVFFDLDDINLKKSRDPKSVTNSITSGLNKSDYMLVIVSPSTYNSPWVPFEIGYAYENMEEKMKILRHKDLPKTGLPEYLKTKEILNGTQSLNRFLNSVRNSFFVYESVQERDSIKLFSSSNPLSNYLSNE